MNRLVTRLSADAPLLFFFENAQWMDPASRELLSYLSERLRSWPILVLVVQRSEDEDKSVQDAKGGQTLTLRPLSLEGTTALVAHLLGDAPAHADLAHAIHQQSGGNPLFVEAIEKSLIARGARRARPGEFTLRAFLNGKMELLEAERVHDLIQAKTRFQAALIREESEDLETSYLRIGELLEMEPEIIKERVERYRDLPAFQPVVFKDDLGEREVARIESRRYELPELVVLAEPKRSYPRDTFAAHVLGYLPTPGLRRSPAGSPPG